MEKRHSSKKAMDALLQECIHRKSIGALPLPKEAEEDLWAA
jgi:hypothetical protein